MSSGDHHRWSMSRVCPWCHVPCPSCPPPQGNKAVSCRDRRGFLGMEEVRFSVMTLFLLWRKPAGGVCRVDGGGSSRCWGALPRAAFSQGIETRERGGSCFPLKQMFLIIFSPSPTETLNHVSAFPAIYMDMIHTRAVSCLQPKPTNLPMMLAFYFLPSPSLGTSELGVSALQGNSSMSD